MSYLANKHGFKLTARLPLFFDLVALAEERIVAYLVLDVVARKAGLVGLAVVD